MPSHSHNSGCIGAGALSGVTLCTIARVQQGCGMSVQPEQQLQELRFCLERPSRRTQRQLLFKGAPTTLVSAPAAQAPTGQRRARKQRQQTFATMTLSGSPATDRSVRVAGASRPSPLFMMASATEAKVSDMPSWRSTVANLAAGATAGCAVEAALYPIDTIKTRLQTMIGGGGWRALQQAGGGKALYAGIWGNLAGVAPSSALFISVYEPIKQAVYRRLGSDQQFWGPVIAGAAAGSVASLIRVPTEVIKQRLQTKEFATAVSAIRNIVAKEGVRGLYAGYGAFMLRDLPFDAIEFVAYEQLKKAYARAVKRDLQTAEVSIVGAAAGGITGIATTPLDVLKTRLMTQGATGRYKGIVDCTMQIVRTEGWGAFLAGWQPRLIWISLGGFVFFPVLEAAKDFYHKSMGCDVSSSPPSTQFVIEELEEADLKAAKKKRSNNQ